MKSNLISINSAMISFPTRLPPSLLRSRENFGSAWKLINFNALFPGDFFSSARVGSHSFLLGSWITKKAEKAERTARE